KVVIQLGQKLEVAFELKDGIPIQPRTAKNGQSKKQNTLALDFHEEKAGRALYLSHYFQQTLRARCLARLKGYDTYFETDILPVQVNIIGREIWSEPIEELVLFDFRVGVEPESGRQISER